MYSLKDSPHVTLWQFHQIILFPYTPTKNQIKIIISPTFSIFGQFSLQQFPTGKKKKQTTLSVGEASKTFLSSFGATQLMCKKLM